MDRLRWRGTAPILSQHHLFGLRVMPSQVQMPSVFDRISRPAAEELCDVGPPLAVLAHLLEQKLVLRLRPRRRPD